ncbi:hypothetical protein [Peptoniphilus sp. Marseille-Q6390]
MGIIFGLIAIFFATKNVLAWSRGMDSSKDCFLSMAFTCLAIFGFYNMGANFLEKGDIAGALDVIPTIRETLFVCTLASIIINGITVFVKKK